MKLVKCFKYSHIWKWWKFLENLKASPNLFHNLKICIFEIIFGFYFLRFGNEWEVRSIMVGTSKVAYPKCGKLGSLHEGILYEGFLFFFEVSGRGGDWGFTNFLLKCLTWIVEMWWDSWEMQIGKSMVLFFWWNIIREPCNAKLEWNVERILMLWNN